MGDSEALRRNRFSMGSLWRAIAVWGCGVRSLFGDVGCDRCFGDVRGDRCFGM
ncbi:hypothetical protein PN478_01655 [Dolichospermum circinale CS-534/05]|uniref:hypothetical protein n=1 Tax=Dolichospermum circinale TaxID=109265 RepID=UPI0023311CAE|nr:hypothetical protein [Dolichospermum circinale]MDB9489239.1 hypothetical protein [Dolichospermum circinale CS-534/05]